MKKSFSTALEEAEAYLPSETPLIPEAPAVPTEPEIQLTEDGAPIMPAAVDDGFDAVDEGLSSMGDLEELTLIVNDCSPNDELAAESFRLTQFALKDIKARLGYTRKVSPVPSLESLKTAKSLKTVALEDIKEFSKKAWATLVKVLKSIKEHLVKFFKAAVEYLASFKRAAQNIKTKPVNDSGKVFTDAGPSFSKGTVTLNGQAANHDGSEADALSAKLSHFPPGRMTALMDMAAYASGQSHVPVLTPDMLLDLTEACRDMVKAIPELYRPWLVILSKATAPDEFLASVKSLSETSPNAPHGFSAKRNGKGGFLVGNGIGLGFYVEGFNGTEPPFSFVDLIEATRTSTQKEAKVELSRNAMRDKIADVVISVADQIASVKTVSDQLDKMIEELVRQTGQVANQSGTGVDEVLKMLRLKSAMAHRLSYGIRTVLNRVSRTASGVNSYLAMSTTLSQAA